MSLDRTAIERVLARAAELQAHAHPESGTLLSDEQILELGKEVGLTPDALRRAIAEERGRVVNDAPSGLLGAWFGGDRFSATRVVPGTPASVLASLDTLFRGELPFEVKRRYPDRLVWEPKHGFFDAMRVAFNARVEGGDLPLAEEVSVLVVPVDGERTHVRIDALLVGRRRSASSNTVLAVSSSALGAFAFSAMAVAPLVALPIAGAWAAAGLVVPRRNYERVATRVELALQQVLDRLEYGPAKRRGLANDIVNRILGPDTR
jgi:hypothetical protein